MNHYPLIEKLGLDLVVQGRNEGFGHTRFVVADKLEELLQSAQSVYGYQYTPTWEHLKTREHTLSARLIMIEEINKKADCEHEPAYVVRKLANLPKADIFSFEDAAVCSKCNVRLRAKWIAE